jgi:hypothetical protein
MLIYVDEATNTTHVGKIPKGGVMQSDRPKCYAVVFMDYRPLAVDSLWQTRKGAETRIMELTNPGQWDVCEMEIKSVGEKVR